MKKYFFSPATVALFAVIMFTATSAESGLVSSPNKFSFSDKCGYYYKKILEVSFLNKKNIMGGKLRLEINKKVTKQKPIFLYLDELTPIHLIKTRPASLQTLEDRVQALNKSKDEIIKVGHLDLKTQNQIIPSKNPIRVFKDNTNRYIVFDGNGRLEAMKRSFSNGRPFPVEVELFELADNVEASKLVVEIKKLRHDSVDYLDSLVPKKIWDGFESLPAGYHEKPVTLHLHVSDRNYAIAQGNLIENISPNKLANNERYTYVYTEDGKWIFGKVTNGWEFGVKHFNLAEGRRVKIAGELFVDANGNYSFNTLSGTYMQRIINRFEQNEQKIYTERVQRIAEKLFEKEFGHTGSQVQTKLLPENPPSLNDLKDLCASKLFLLRNRALCL